jgi:nonsense-mediated mRNA decay protein 3
MRCAQCLKAEVSITEGISRQIALQRCRGCERYNRPPWTKCELESRTLLGLCLKKVRGIGKEVRLVDASFIWTEEHSRRIRVKLTVQKEIASQSVLQQSVVVEFTIVNQQCEDCQKSFTPHAWNAIVQVRQKVAHRRTFCYLEQLILKTDAHEKVISIKENREGLDFHFSQRSHAQRFADFVMGCVPSKQKNSKHLISHDAKSNLFNYKYTIMLELCPVCRDDVVHVPKGISQQLCGCPQLMLCHKVSNGVRLVDPLTLHGVDIASQEYWKRPLDPVCTRKHLTEFVVLNIEPVEAPEMGTPMKHRLSGRGRMALADIEVAKAADFGVNDDRLVVRSHLGSILRPGNRVLGYDLRTVNVSGLDSTTFDNQAADVFLVRRAFKKRRKRAWMLRRLARDKEEGAEAVDDEEDMEALQQDLEEDPELRKGITMYRTSDGPPAPAGAAAGGGGQEDEDEDEDDEAPEVPLAELLEGLSLGPDNGGDGADVDIDFLPQAPSSVAAPTVAKSPEATVPTGTGSG